jgi:hypothetical protein
MRHQETFRSEDGGSSKFEVYDRDGQEIIVAQRDSELVKVWIRGWVPSATTPPSPWAGGWPRRRGGCRKATGR